MPRLSKIGAAALAAFGWTGLSSVSASYLVVAGGGGGAGSVGSYGGGGGGAGGYQTGTTSLNTTLSYTITVGAGGAGSAGGAGAIGTNGANSQIGSLTASVGGGGGASASSNNGNNGGSGGAGGPPAGSGGTATSGQGNRGGNASATRSGSGGGGAGSAGTDTSASGYAIPSNGVSGGTGTTSAISGATVTYAGGGGGGGMGSGGSGGAGGSSVGGAGANGASGLAGGTGVVNTGSGGGGGSSDSGGGTTTAGGQGGSGVVIISYPAPQQFGGGVVTTSGSNVIHTFNTSGTLSPLSSLTASYLIVAGGGAGGGAGGYVGGGGGAGGYLTGSGITIDSNSIYLVTVGAGGAGSTTALGASGTNSTFSMVTTAAVGGGGGGATSGTSGANGGSGGGCGYSGGTFGTGTSGQGNNGAIGSGVLYGTGGGGGGSNTAGFNGGTILAGSGGTGTTASAALGGGTYAGGGGGAAGAGGTKGNGGSAIGGNGADTTAATSGSTNTGSGGGGANSTSTTSGSGGSGVVIISYAGSTQQMAGGTVTISGGNVIHTFTSSGYLTPIKYVNNSLRFRSSASAYLNRTLTTPTSGTKWTWSGWVKRGILTNGTGTAQQLFSAGSATAFFRFSQTDTLLSGWTGAANLETTQVFRDPSAWYHIMLVVDTTQATASNRVKYYVNGVQITAFSTTDYPTQNSTTTINSAVAHNIGAYTSSTQYYDGYLTEVNFVDGQALTPNSFGTFNSYGVWQPITYGGSYGTNGFYLPFTNKTSTTTLGYDFSPNGNNWTTNNISLTAGSTYDSMTDVPTLTSATAANYAVLNPIGGAGASLGINSGNLQWSYTANSNINGYATMYMQSGQWYVECEQTSGTNTDVVLGFATQAFGQQATASLVSDSGYFGYTYAGRSWNFGSQTNGNTTLTVGTDVMNFAIDITNGKAWIGKNGTWFGSGNPATGANPWWTFTAGTAYTFAMAVYNAVGWINFGQRPFSNTPPTGYVALNTYNL